MDHEIKEKYFLFYKLNWKYPYNKNDSLGAIGAGKDDNGNLKFDPDVYCPYDFDAYSVLFRDDRISPEKLRDWFKVINDPEFVWGQSIWRLPFAPTMTRGTWTYS